MTKNPIDNTSTQKKNVLKNTDSTTPFRKAMVRRRNDDLTNFAPEKIENALHKAFLSQNNDPQKVHFSVIKALTQKILRSLERFLENEGEIIHIEDIQDQVELALMRGGHYEVARAYVLYREQRAQRRLIQSKSGKNVSGMHVVKRNKTKQLVSLDKITNRVSILSKGLNIDPIVVAQKAIVGLFDGISTESIDQFLSETAAALIVEHPDYSVVAARIKVNSLHKTTPGFIDATRQLYQDGLLNDEYYKCVEQHKKDIMSIIEYERDYISDYFALTTLIKAYLLRIGNRLVERPQDMWMRVALTCCRATKKFDKNVLATTYDMLSRGIYIHATPTLFNSGLKMQQLSSCFLIAMEDDSIEGIFNTLKDTALISKTAGGIGIHAHNIRGQGSIIKSTNGTSNGLIPFLKIFNATARCVDQGGGKRKGSFAIYIEPWHADVEDFLTLRKNTGAEEFRARDLFYALWIPDIFMRRVKEDGQWTLMSPHQCPRLSDVYGEKFDALYTQYEKEGRGTKVMPARALMALIIEAQIETGQPYMLYKDSINKKSNQKNIGTIKSSNLCAEIVEYSDEKETAVCNLASLALPKFVQDNDEYDYHKLYEVVKVATKNLDHIIDANFYPTEKARLSNTRHRPIALGVQGLADVFFKMGLAFDSPKSAEINVLIFETIYFGAIQASMELAREYGPYSTYAGSPISKGQFQFDMWNTVPSPLWDWQALRRDVAKYGVRNSLTTACMPTASTGTILGNTETTQAQTSNIYKRQTLSGEFLLVNRFLVEELTKRNLWNKEMRDAIILENGSVQNIDKFPADLKDIYKTVWEISQKVVIDMARDRAPYIDQTQSMNLWLSNPTFGQVSSMHMHSWQSGLKTGMYYLRSRSAVDAVKVTVSSERNQRPTTQQECLECSS